MMDSACLFTRARDDAESHFIALQRLAREHGTNVWNRKKFVFAASRNVRTEFAVPVSASLQCDEWDGLIGVGIVPTDDCCRWRRASKGKHRVRTTPRAAGQVRRPSGANLTLGARGGRMR